MIVSCNENERKVIDGGAAISICTKFRTTCAVNKDERSSDYGYFADMTTCNSRIKDLKEYGLKIGDPVCIPCSKIVYQSNWNRFSCEWVE